MSSNYAVLGLSMAAAGVLTELYGPRTVWLAGGVVFLVAAARRARDDEMAPDRSRGGARRDGGERRVRRRGAQRACAATRAGARTAANGAGNPPLERIATLLEEIEERRAAEAKRGS